MDWIGTMSKVILKIESGDDRREVANILISNGYMVWEERICTLDMGGMAGSEYEYHLHAQEIGKLTTVKRRVGRK
jgi:hypothetical protein